jgi:hypothetical protein
MPNQRAPGQKLVTVPMKEEFIAAIDSYVLDQGTTKAALIRDAVYEKITRMGLPVPKNVSYAPGRTGKGGKKK